MHEQELIAGRGNEQPRFPPGTCYDGESIEKTLHGIPSRFEQLEYIAALAHDARDNATNPRATIEALDDAHMALFEQWLSLDLVQKLEDLWTYAHRRQRSCLELIGGRRSNSGSRCKLIPDRALPSQRGLFEIEIDMLLLVPVLDAEMSRPPGTTAANRLPTNNITGSGRGQNGSGLSGRRCRPVSVRIAQRSTKSARCNRT